MVTSLLGPDLPIRIQMWDGSELGRSGSKTMLVVKSPMALRRLLYAPNELGFGRAYVAGDLDLQGDIFAALALRENLSVQQSGAEPGVKLGLSGWLKALKAARELHLIGPPLPAPPEEAHLHGRRHGTTRDAAAISHHYDVSNEFYRLFLGETMTYSCAYFADERWELDRAQEAKYELVCRKLALCPGMRLLDVGCGWGGMVMHAARLHGVKAVGVTLSRNQEELARKRVAEAGLSSEVEIRYQDYREVKDGPYDAISSIGMFEHVGLARLGEYFAALGRLLRPGGRVLNHAISKPSGPSKFQRNSFVERYVFPDGELHEVGTVVSAMQAQKLEVRDVESLREHYARTLRAWVSNLEARWDEAISLAGPARARIWRLYMAGSALGFEAGRISVHQVLAVKPTDNGSSGMAPTRRDFVGWEQDAS